MNFLPTKISIAVALLLMVSPSLGFNTREKQCNLTSHYRIVDDKSLNFLACFSCHNCQAGEEPLIPCGSNVLNSVSIGYCKECLLTTYSTAHDTRPCQICPNPKCAEHEMVICDRKKGHNSRCIGNTTQPNTKSTNKTLTQNTLNVLDTTLTQNTMKNPDTIHTQNTAKNPDPNMDKVGDEMPVGLVFGIIFGSVCSFAFIGTPLYICWCSVNRLRRRYIQVKLSEQVVQLEEPAAPVLPPPVLPVGEPPDLFLARPPPYDHLLRPLPPPYVQYPPEPPRYVPPDPMHFDNVPSGLYNEICTTFDHGPPEKDTNSLAAKLLISGEACHLEGKADAIIQSWKSIRGNNVPKFVEILIDMNMTDLADTLKDYMGQVQLI